MVSGFGGARSGRDPKGSDGGEIGPGRRGRAGEMRCGHADGAIRFVGSEMRIVILPRPVSFHDLVDAEAMADDVPLRAAGTT
uniref:Uncharacterized protein n=1 Tax=Arundo donax TaxID=35708 RepID=A0A0A9F1I4_ARUDO